MTEDKKIIMPMDGNKTQNSNPAHEWKGVLVSSFFTRNKKWICACLSFFFFVSTFQGWAVAASSRYDSNGHLIGDRVGNKGKIDSWIPFVAGCVSGYMTGSGIANSGADEEEGVSKGLEELIEDAIINILQELIINSAGFLISHFGGEWAETPLIRIGGFDLSNGAVVGMLISIATSVTAKALKTPNPAKEAAKLAKAVKSGVTPKKLGIKGVWAILTGKSTISDVCTGVKDNIFKNMSGAVKKGILDALARIVSAVPKTFLQQVWSVVKEIFKAIVNKCLELVFQALFYNVLMKLGGGDETLAKLFSPVLAGYALAGIKGMQLSGGKQSRELVDETVDAEQAKDDPVKMRKITRDASGKVTEVSSKEEAATMGDVESDGDNQHMVKKVDTNEEYVLCYDVKNLSNGKSGTMYFDPSAGEDGKGGWMIQMDGSSESIAVDNNMGNNGQYEAGGSDWQLAGGEATTETTEKAINDLSNPNCTSVTLKVMRRSGSVGLTDGSSVSAALLDAIDQAKAGGNATVDVTEYKDNGDPKTDANGEVVTKKMSINEYVKHKIKVTLSDGSTKEVKAGDIESVDEVTGTVILRDGGESVAGKLVDKSDAHLIAAVVDNQAMADRAQVQTVINAFLTRCHLNPVLDTKGRSFSELSPWEAAWEGIKMMGVAPLLTALFTWVILKCLEAGTHKNLRKMEGRAEAQDDPESIFMIGAFQAVSSFGANLLTEAVVNIPGSEGVLGSASRSVSKDELAKDKKAYWRHMGVTAVKGFLGMCWQIMMSYQDGATQKVINGYGVREMINAVSAATFASVADVLGDGFDWLASKTGPAENEGYVTSHEYKKDDKSKKVYKDSNTSEHYDKNADNGTFADNSGNVGFQVWKPGEKRAKNKDEKNKDGNKKDEKSAEGEAKTPGQDVPFDGNKLYPGMAETLSEGWKPVDLVKEDKSENKEDKAEANGSGASAESAAPGEPAGQPSAKGGEAATNPTLTIAEVAAKCDKGVQQTEGNQTFWLYTDKNTKEQYRLTEGSGERVENYRKAKEEKNQITDGLSKEDKDNFDKGGQTVGDNGGLSVAAAASAWGNRNTNGESGPVEVTYGGKTFTLTKDQQDTVEAYLSARHGTEAKASEIIAGKQSKKADSETNPASGAANGGTPANSGNSGSAQAKPAERIDREDTSIGPGDATPLRGPKGEIAVAKYEGGSLCLTVLTGGKEKTVKGEVDNDTGTVTFDMSQAGGKGKVTYDIVSGQEYSGWKNGKDKGTAIILKTKDGGVVVGRRKEDSSDITVARSDGAEETIKQVDGKYKTSEGVELSAAPNATPALPMTVTTGIRKAEDTPVEKLNKMSGWTKAAGFLLGMVPGLGYVLGKIDGHVSDPGEASFFHQLANVAAAPTRNLLNDLDVATSFATADKFLSTPDADIRHGRAAVFNKIDNFHMKHEGAIMALASGGTMYMVDARTASHEISRQAEQRFTDSMSRGIDNIFLRREDRTYVHYMSADDQKALFSQPVQARSPQEAEDAAKALGSLTDEDVKTMDDAASTAKKQEDIKKEILARTTIEKDLGVHRGPADAKEAGNREAVVGLLVGEAAGGANSNSGSQGQGALKKALVEKLTKSGVSGYAAEKLADDFLAHKDNYTTSKPEDVRQSVEESVNRCFGDQVLRQEVYQKAFGGNGGDPAKALDAIINNEQERPEVVAAAKTIAAEYVQASVRVNKDSLPGNKDSLEKVDNYNSARLDTEFAALVVTAYGGKAQLSEEERNAKIEELAARYHIQGADAKQRYAVVAKAYEDYRSTDVLPAQSSPADSTASAGEKKEGAAGASGSSPAAASTASTPTEKFYESYKKTEKEAASKAEIKDPAVADMVAGNHQEVEAAIGLGEHLQELEPKTKRIRQIENIIVSSGGLGGDTLRAKDEAGLYQALTKRTGAVSAELLSDSLGLSKDDAKALFAALEKNGYIDDKGVIQDKFNQVVEGMKKSGYDDQGGTSLGKQLWSDVGNGKAPIEMSLGGAYDAEPVSGGDGYYAKAKKIEKDIDKAKVYFTLRQCYTSAQDRAIGKVVESASGASASDPPGYTTASDPMVPGVLRSLPDRIKGGTVYLRVNNNISTGPSVGGDQNLLSVLKAHAEERNSPEEMAMAQAAGGSGIASTTNYQITVAGVNEGRATYSSASLGRIAADGIRNEAIAAKEGSTENSMYRQAYMQKALESDSEVQSITDPKKKEAKKKEVFKKVLDELVEGPVVTSKSVLTQRDEVDFLGRTTKTSYYGFKPDQGKIDDKGNYNYKMDYRKLNESTAYGHGPFGQEVSYTQNDEVSVNPPRKNSLKRSVTDLADTLASSDNKPADKAKKKPDEDEPEYRPFTVGPSRHYTMNVYTPGGEVSPWVAPSMVIEGSTSGTSNFAPGASSPVNTDHYSQKRLSQAVDKLGRLQAKLDDQGKPDSLSEDERDGKIKKSEQEIRELGGEDALNRAKEHASEYQQKFVTAGRLYDDNNKDRKKLAGEILDNLDNQAGLDRVRDKYNSAHANDTIAPQEMEAMATEVKAAKGRNKEVEGFMGSADAKYNRAIAELAIQGNSDGVAAVAKANNRDSESAMALFNTYRDKYSGNSSASAGSANAIDERDHFDGSSHPNTGSLPAGDSEGFLKAAQRDGAQTAAARQDLSKLQSDNRATAVYGWVSGTIVNGHSGPDAPANEREAGARIAAVMAVRDNQVREEAAAPTGESGRFEVSENHIVNGVTTLMPVFGLTYAYNPDGQSLRSKKEISYSYKAEEINTSLDSARQDAMRIEDPVTRQKQLDRLNSFQVYPSVGKTDVKTDDKSDYAFANTGGPSNDLGAYGTFKTVTYLGGSLGDKKPTITRGSTVARGVAPQYSNAAPGAGVYRQAP